MDYHHHQEEHLQLLGQALDVHYEFLDTDAGGAILLAEDGIRVALSLLEDEELKVLDKLLCGPTRLLGVEGSADVDDIDITSHIGQYHILVVEKFLFQDGEGDVDVDHDAGHGGDHQVSPLDVLQGVGRGIQHRGGHRGVRLQRHFLISILIRSEA